MATTAPSRATGNGETTPGSSKHALIPSFPKHVFLYDWWLIKADTAFDGRVLAVGGLSSKEQLGLRILHSAAIVKRHNTNTVEAADGLTITFSGSINKSRTVLNGFPLEVCNQFFFGFPYCWEEFCSVSFPKEASNRPVDNSTDGSSNLLVKSFDNLPGALIRDLVVSTIESPGRGNQVRSIFEDMQEIYGENSLNQRDELVYPSKEKNQVIKDSIEDGTRNEHKKMKTKQKQKDENHISGAKSRKSFHRGVHQSGIRPSTRGMSPFASEAPLKQNCVSESGKDVSSLSSTTRTLLLRNRSIDFLDSRKRPKMEFKE